MEKIVSPYIADCISGNTGILFTICHDGYLISLNGKTIPFTRSRRINDVGTRNLALDIHRMTPEKLYPYLVLQNIERQRMHGYIRKYFYENQILYIVRECFRRFGYCTLLDLHAFINQPEIGDFDLIFGTNHRATIDYDLDFQIAGIIRTLFKESSELVDDVCIYIPSEEPREGEKFGATSNITLTNWIKQREPSVNSMQIEVASHWLEDIYRRRLLAKIFSQMLHKLTP